MSDSPVSPSSIADVRLLVLALTWGESLTLDAAVIGAGQVDGYLSRTVETFAPRRHEWSIDGSFIHIRRMWDVYDDKWGLSKLTLESPEYIKGASHSDLGTVRAVASQQRKRMGRVVQCKSDGMRLAAMLVSNDLLPEPMSKCEAPKGMTASDFAIMQAPLSGGRPLRYPIALREVGDDIFIAGTSVTSEAALRAFYMRHGKRLRQGFSIKKFRGGYMVTRKY